MAETCTVAPETTVGYWQSRADAESARADAAEARVAVLEKRARIVRDAVWAASDLP